MLRPRGAEDARVYGGVGYQRCALGDLVADLAHSFDVFVIKLAEVVPDAGGLRNDVGLIAAVGDHVVRALLGAEVFAAEVPADVHQLDGVERAASLPRRSRGVRAFA